MKAARWSTLVMTAMTARIETNIPEAPTYQLCQMDRICELTNTLYSTTKYEDGHALGNGADQTTEFEKEDGAEKDMFGLDDGKQLTDE